MSGERQYNGYELPEVDIAIAAMDGEVSAINQLTQMYLPYMKALIIKKADKSGLRIDILPLEDILHEVVIGYIQSVDRFKII